jgi:outer membrane protein assembly factor BamD
MIRALPVLGAAACASASPYEGLTAEDLYEQGRSAFEAENWSDAADALDFLLLRVSSASFEHAADARFMLAQAHFNDESYLTAESEFIRFLERFPGDERRGEAALGVCRCYAALSPIPERDQTYTKRAESTCRNVVQDYAGIDDEIASEAQEIVNEMRGKLGEKEYKNGMFYFRNEYWLSAIDYFEMVHEDFGDTEWAPRAIARMIEAYDEVGYDTEVELWRETLLNSYPNSPEAKALMSDVGSDPTVAGG